MTDSSRHDIRHDSSNDTPRATRREVLGLDDAADRAGVSRRTLQRAIERGELARFEVEGRAMVDAAALASWGATRQKPAPSSRTKPPGAHRPDTDSVAPDQAALVESLRAEVRHLQLRLDYAEGIARDRQATITSLSSSVATLSAALAAGITPASLAPGQIEVATAGQPSPATVAPDAAERAETPRSASIAAEVMVQDLDAPPAPTLRKWWWPF
jgi:hypothetical protein